MIRDPDTRPNERTRKGEQPYKDDREAMGRQDEELQHEAERIGEQTQDDQDQDDSLRRLEQEAEERLAKIKRSR